MKHTKLSDFGILTGLILEILAFAIIYFFEYVKEPIIIFSTGAIIALAFILIKKKLYGLHIYVAISTFTGLISLGVYTFLIHSKILMLLNLVNLVLAFFAIATHRSSKKRRFKQKVISEEEQLKYSKEAEKIFRELDRIESNLISMEKEAKETSKQEKKKSVSTKKAKKTIKKEKKTTTKNSSKDANLVACNQEHEMATILKNFNKVNSKENREVMKKLCKQFKLLESKKPHNRDNFYKYIKTLAEFKTLESVKKKQEKKTTKSMTKKISKRTIKTEQKYTAIKEGKTFHLPSCTILLRQDPKKYVHYKSREDAMAKAHRPCRVCNP